VEGYVRNGYILINLSRLIHMIREIEIQYAVITKFICSIRSWPLNQMIDLIIVYYCFADSGLSDCFAIPVVS
jgi:hypothetical protein